MRRLSVLGALACLGCAGSWEEQRNVGTPAPVAHVACGAGSASARVEAGPDGVDVFFGRGMMLVRGRADAELSCKGDAVRRAAPKRDGGT